MQHAKSAIMVALISFGVLALTTRVQFMKNIAGL